MDESRAAGYSAPLIMCLSLELLGALGALARAPFLCPLALSGSGVHIKKLKNT